MSASHTGKDASMPVFLLKKKMFCETKHGSIWKNLHLSVILERLTHSQSWSLHVIDESNAAQQLALQLGVP